MIGRLDGSRFHAGQHQQTAHLFAHSCEQFEFAATVCVRKAVLHVNNANHAVPRNYRR